MKILENCLFSRSRSILSLLLISFVSFSLISCSKDGGDSDEDDDEEKFTITYRIFEPSVTLKPNILEVSYIDAKGDKITTDYAGFGLGKEIRVAKPFDAIMSVKSHNPSTTEYAQMKLQISLGLNEVQVVEVSIEPNTTLTHEIKYVLR